jgi:hypothetical protein
MHSKYNYSPSTASLRFSKSTSGEKFYRQATERAHHYESKVQIPTSDCLACRHEHQIPIKHPSNRTLTLPQTDHMQSQLQDYYPQPAKQEMDNLRKSKRFLEELLNKNKDEYRANIARN